MNSDILFHIALYIPIPLLVNYILATKLILSKYFWQCRLQQDYYASNDSALSSYKRYYKYNDDKATVIKCWETAKSVIRKYDIYLPRPSNRIGANYIYMGNNAGEVTENKLEEVTTNTFNSSKFALVELYPVNYWKNIHPYLMFYFDSSPYITQIYSNNLSTTNIIISWFIDWRGNKIGIVAYTGIETTWTLSNRSIYGQLYNYDELLEVNKLVKEDCIGELYALRRRI
jgi:hypothetical protein